VGDRRRGRRSGSGPARPSHPADLPARTAPGANRGGQRGRRLGLRSPEALHLSDARCFRWIWASARRLRKP
jgi:hypothetical protein